MDRKYRLYLKLLEMSGTKPLRYADLSTKLYYSDDEILKDLLFEMKKRGLVKIKDKEINLYTIIRVIPGMITINKNGIMQIHKRRVTA